MGKGLTMSDIKSLEEYRAEKKKKVKPKREQSLPVPEGFINMVIEGRGKISLPDDTVIGLDTVLGSKQFTVSVTRRNRQVCIEEGSISMVCDVVMESGRSVKKSDMTPDDLYQKLPPGTEFIFNAEGTRIVGIKIID